MRVQSEDHNPQKREVSSLGMIVPVGDQCRDFSGHRAVLCTVLTSSRTKHVSSTLIGVYLIQPPRSHIPTTFQQLINVGRVIKVGDSITHLEGALLSPDRVDRTVRAS